MTDKNKDYKKERGRAFLAGYAGVPVAGSVANMTYGAGIGVLGKSKHLPSEFTSAADALKRTMGLGAVGIRHGAGASFSPGKGSYPEWIKKILPVPPAGITIGRPNMPTLAHELGHAKNFKSLGPKRSRVYAGTRVGGSIGSQLAALVAAIQASTGDGDAGRTAGVIGSTAMLPTLLEETIASGRGSKGLYKFLRSSGTGAAKAALQSAGSFKGVPTYAVATAIPYLAYLATKAVRDRKKQ
jgi:hypothetical protein